MAHNPQRPVQALLGAFVQTQQGKSNRTLCANFTNTEIPRRINSTNIFTSKGDDFDNLVLSLASFPQLYIIFCDPLSQIRASEMIFSGRFKSKQRVET
jgi:hypothetical protein